MPPMDEARPTLKSSCIERSWQRCLSHGLAPAMQVHQDPLAPVEVRQLREQNRRLVEVALPILDGIQASVAASRGVVMLADFQGVILESRGDPGFAGRAQRVFLQAGACWDEAHEATNAIGTALVERSMVHVNGTGHFFESNRFLACTAKPVRNPQGRIVGVVDVSGDALQPRPDDRLFVESTVAQIEREWVRRGDPFDLLVSFHPHVAWLETAAEGLIAFRDGELVGANSIAFGLLGLNCERADPLRWEDLFSTPLHAGEALLRTQRGGDVFPCRFTRPARVMMPVRSGVTLDDGIVWDAGTRSLLDRAVRAVEAQIPVLVQGETGTGKEIFVRTLHARSSRARGAYVAVNCAAIPEGLLESELFGYEDGAFTGARRQGRAGRIRQADGGVLFLDEVGDMPLALQARLLRVLQDGEVLPLGGGRAVKVDFQLVAATHHNLRQAVADGRFREDLYYRLRHFLVVLPPLRERGDLAGILDALCDSHGARRRRVSLSEDLRTLLLRHAWPGNLREMSNVLRVMISLAGEGEVLGVECLPPDLREALMAEAAKRSGASQEPGCGESFALGPVAASLAAHQGNASAAAKALGIHRSTLYRRLAAERST